MGMIERLRALGKPWRLHYAARTRQQCAFADLLQGLRDSEGAGCADCASSFGSCALKRGGTLALRLRPRSCEALHDKSEGGTEVRTVEWGGLQGATNVPSTSPYSATPIN